MVDCINSKHCKECDSRNCCYWRYFKGTHSCENKLDCMKYCRNYNYKLLSDEIDLAECNFSYLKFKKPYNERIKDKFIPRLELSKYQLINDIKKAGIDTIAISALEFFTPKSKFTKITRKIRTVNGIHNYLDFDGNIILTTNMLDSMCDVLSSDLYLRLIKAIKPDIITTFDTYYYDDQPYFITKLKLYETIKKNMELAHKTDKPVIAMSIGSYSNLFTWFNSTLFQMGCQYYMIPCYYFPFDYKNGIKRIPDKVSILKQIDEKIKIILIGASPIKTRKLYLINNFSSGLTVNKSKNKYSQIIKYKNLAEDLSYQKTLR